MARDDTQTNLRLPADLKDRLVEVADANNRSLSAEVTARLTQSFEPVDRTKDERVQQLEQDVATLKHEAVFLAMGVKMFLTNIAAESPLIIALGDLVDDWTTAADRFVKPGISSLAALSFQTSEDEAMARISKIVKIVVNAAAVAYAEKHPGTSHEEAMAVVSAEATAAVEQQRAAGRAVSTVFEVDVPPAKVSKPRRRVSPPAD